MSFLGERNAIALGVSQHAVLGSGPLLTQLSPSLLLQFAGAQTMDPRITFTRASTATFTGQDGLIQTAAVNAPRFDYSPTTLAALGLLIEEQRVNLLTYSEQFNNAAWTKTRSSITADAIVAPDGTLTGDKLVEDTTASASHPLISSITAITVNVTSSFSIYAKAGERTALVLRLNTGADSIWGSFNLATGTVGSTLNSGTGSGAALAITAVGNGWYRCTLSGIFSTTASFVSAIVYPAVSTTDPAGSSIVYTGNGTSGVFIWGAQLEVGAFPTSYIPTVASQVTRAADNASMTGTNFSSWYNAVEGTLCVEGSVGYTVPATSFPILASLNDGTSNNRIEAGYVTASVTSFEVVTSGVAQVGLFPSAAGAVLRKVAGAYQVNNFAVSINGSAVSTDTSGTIPTVNLLRIGDRTGLSNMNGYIRQIVYYPRRLSNAQLQAITD